MDKIRKTHKLNGANSEIQYTHSSLYEYNVKFKYYKWFYFLFII